MDRPEVGLSPPRRDRYTLDGDGAVEARIGRDQSVIAAAVQALVPPGEFRGLVLMGGYGRGEGGYRLGAGGPEPYNDYDYFVVVGQTDRAGRHQLTRTLAERARALEHEVGVEVDFALLREEALPRAEYSLMNAEMLWGHRVVAGDPGVLGTMPPMPFGGLPRGEFTRLLLNRGALLLMNQQRLAAGESLGAAQREVFFKYLFKAVLACGDARLAGNGCYDPSYVRKREVLETTDWTGKETFMTLYAQAWDNKFHPDYGRYAGEDAAAWQGRVVGLWLETLAWFEQVRTGRPVADWEVYGAPAFPKGQAGGPGGPWRNLVITARDFGLGELVRRPRWSLRYPRERLIAALPVLLSRPGQAATPAVAEALARPVGTPWSEAAAAFLGWWRRYA